MFAKSIAVAKNTFAGLITAIVERFCTEFWGREVKSAVIANTRILKKINIRIFFALSALGFVTYASFIPK